MVEGNTQKNGGVTKGDPSIFEQEMGRPNMLRFDSVGTEWTQQL